MKKDPDTYRACNVVRENDEAQKDMQAFLSDVQEARKKHRIPEVHLAISVPCGDGDAYASLTLGAFALAMRLASYAYGRAEAVEEEARDKEKASARKLGRGR